MFFRFRGPIALAHYNPNRTALTLNAQCIAMFLMEEIIKYEEHKAVTRYRSSASSLGDSKFNFSSSHSESGEENNKKHQLLFVA